MVYDAARSKCVYFGGFGGGNLDETWLYDGANWNQANPTSAPSPRRLFGFAYDTQRQVVVLFGGLAAS
jgi:hypothetical protein